MTKDEIIRSNKEFLIPSDIADVLGVDADSIRRQAGTAPAMLGFPVIRVGTRTIIPRKRFCDFLGWEVPDDEKSPV